MTPESQIGRYVWYILAIAVLSIMLILVLY